ncbi:MAG: anthranilate synthase component I, partial [Methanosarcinales archaeon]|nr:anthranilate synthase component I [Methanosarcinales archaeon]
MNDIQLDLTQTEFCNLVAERRPAIIQMGAKTVAGCKPFELYHALRENNGKACKYSYLLESVEKEQ